MSVEHQEPTRCPVFIPEPGAIVQTGATVVDGSTRDFTENRLLIVTADGSPLRRKIAIFGYDQQNRWISAPYQDYPAGTAGLRPDQAYFDLTFRSGASGPTAQMSISYTDAVNASISGPSIVQPSGTYTWSASISSGLAPFRYRWYRDWELVGTGFSYTGLAGGDTTLLRLDVIDARGEVDSHTKRILVNYCEGARVC
ncbi:MAG TPA: hypothetical protein VHG08_14790 [Longimicrobium sp.]|nr:hypothetical protein [Longimicrobium sp.]